MTAKLFIVATPIGNLKDITLRALEVLEAVDWIACEDTRHSKKLLTHFGISKPLISLHDHNELSRSEELLVKLEAGENGALISDAGTPLISDPGYHLVHYLREKSIQVEPIPGASALITALSAAGMPTDRFTFEGFLPAKNAKRRDKLQALMLEERTLVFYESTHRLMDSLEDIVTVLGADRRIVVAKELTKQFERFISGEAQQVRTQLKENPDWQKGEFVLVISGADVVGQDESAEYDRMIDLLIEEGLPVKQISKIVASFFGANKKEIYQLCLEKKR